MPNPLSVSLRPATQDDAELLWNWANDPVRRQSAFNSAAIDWWEHVEWLKKRLENSETYIFIGCDAKGVPIGQIRFDVSAGDADIDLSVDPEYRGAGLAKQLVQAGMGEIIRRMAIQQFIATVKLNNQASRRTFESCGFAPSAEIFVCGCPVVRYIRRVSVGD